MVLCCVPFLEEMAYSLILYPVTCIKAGSVFLERTERYKGKEEREKKKGAQGLNSKQLVLVIAILGEHRRNNGCGRVELPSAPFAF